MIVKTCGKRQILNPCALADLNYQVDPYIECEHHCYYCYVLDRAETDWMQKVLFYPEEAAIRFISWLAKIRLEREFGYFDAVGEELPF